ncbi:MAG: alpha/beta hydrolase [Mesorhizobium sp.]|nr:MAG: alpha/beta hydrolase [Mesorhizobium sp.]
MTTSPLAAELSGLDPQARHVLDLGRQAAAPPFETGTPEEARRAYDQGSPDLQGEREPVGLVGERIIAGPGGSLTLRIYRGQGAPEHKFPAAVEDCRAVLSFMRDEAGALGIDARRIAVAGDSAGGNLAAVLSLLARDDRIPVTAQLLLYPNTDAAQTADSYRRFAEGFGLTASTMAWFRDQYVRDAGDIDDWRVSPLKTKGLAGAAPAFVAIAGHDILADEGEAYARRLQDGGVPVVLKRWPGQIHGFVSMGRHGPASRQAVEAAVAAWRSFDPG